MPKFVPTLLALVAAALLAGCGGLSAPRPELASAAVAADGTRVIDVPPEPTACRATPCLELGGRWTSQHPEVATVLVRHGSGPVTALSLNVNGQSLVLPPAPDSLLGPGAGPGVAAFVAPMSALRRLATGSLGWAQATTAQGVVQGTLADGKLDSPAYLAVRRLVNTIDRR